MTAGDPFKLRDAALRAYILEITNAEANSANEGVPDQVPEAEAIRERNVDTFQATRADLNPFGT